MTPSRSTPSTDSWSASRTSAPALGHERRHRRGEVLEVRRHVGERRVELVRDPGRERSDRDEPIGERQARRDLAARGGVAEHRERDARLDVRDDVPLHHARVARGRHGPLSLPRGARAGRDRCGPRPTAGARAAPRTWCRIRSAAAFASRRHGRRDRRSRARHAHGRTAREPLTAAERLLRRPRVDGGRHHVRDRLRKWISSCVKWRGFARRQEHAVAPLLPTHRHREAAEALAAAAASHARLPSRRTSAL